MGEQARREKFKKNFFDDETLAHLNYCSMESGVGVLNPMRRINNNVIAVRDEVHHWPVSQESYSRQSCRKSISLSATD